MRNAKWWTVAAHEFGIHVRRKGFIAATLGVPLLFAVGFGLIVLFMARGETPKGVGYIDQSGITSAQPDRVVITDTLQLDVPLIRYTDEAAARADTEAERIDGYVVIPADYLATGSLRAVSDDLPSVSKDALRTFLRRTLAANNQSAASPRLSRVITEVRSRTPDGAREATRAQGVLLFFTPYLFSMFFFIGIFTSSSYLMTALVEEKENRVMEILATSIKPFSLMAGKIFGLGLLGLTQITIWTAAAFGMFSLAKLRFPDMAGLSLPSEVVLIAVVMFIPAYLLVAASLSTIGAAVSAVQEGQQLSGIVSVLMISPVWFLTSIINNPHSVLAVFTSIFPFTAPIVMMQRVAITTVPAWQILLAWIVQVGAAIGMMWIAGRVLRFGMLRYGKRLTVRELGQALRG
ncbi:MAG: ABC transporter permease [Herpetosiphonaceae bacterium]|nr:ABC transporter permease [Herpetosiphonaceae bacterium]